MKSLVSTEVDMQSTITRSDYGAIDEKMADEDAIEVFVF
jgi:hypothetical protein